MRFRGPPTFTHATIFRKFPPLSSRRAECPLQILRLPTRFGRCRRQRQDLARCSCPGGIDRIRCGHILFPCAKRYRALTEPPRPMATRSAAQGERGRSLPKLRTRDTVWTHTARQPFPIERNGSSSKKRTYLFNYLSSRRLFDSLADWRFPNTAPLSRRLGTQNAAPDRFECPIRERPKAPLLQMRSIFAHLVLLSPDIHARAELVQIVECIRLREPYERRKLVINCHWGEPRLPVSFFYVYYYERLRAPMPSHHPMRRAA